MTLRRSEHSWRDIDKFLNVIGGVWAKSAHKWRSVLVNQDLDEVSIDERGSGKMIRYETVFQIWNLKLYNSLFNNVLRKKHYLQLKL